MLDPHQIQPGAVDEDRAPLVLVPDDGGPAIRVVDRIQGTQGSYAIVTHGDSEPGILVLIADATIAENYSVQEPEREPDPAVAQLQAENEQLQAQLAAQQQTPPVEQTPPAEQPAPVEPAPAGEPVTVEPVTEPGV